VITIALAGRLCKVGDPASQAAAYWLSPTAMGSGSVEDTSGTLIRRTVARAAEKTQQNEE
jgi:hypothetical protein